MGRCVLRLLVVLLLSTLTHLWNMASPLVVENSTCSINASAWAAEEQLMRS
jgi:hypothetical protein